MTSQLANASPTVLLLGDGPTTLTALRSLVASCTVLAVLRAPAEGASDPVRTYAAEHDIPVRPLNEISELGCIIRDLRPDVVVISSFNRILKPAVLALSRFINVHYSPLPRLRGRANVNWAIINGDPAAAISIHFVSPGLDDGEILLQAQTPISPTDNASSIYDRLGAIQERELGAAVLRAVNGDRGAPQDQGAATYGCSRTPRDGEIDWRQGSVAIERLVRALSPPFPGAFTYLNGQRLLVVRAALRDSPPVYEGRIPGRVIDRSRRDGWVDVLTGDGILRLWEVATDATGAMPAATLIQSTRASLGLSRLDLLQRIETLERRLNALEDAAARSAASEASYSSATVG